MSTPRITNTVINGKVWSLFLNKNRTTSDAIVIARVNILKVWKVWIRDDKGLVRAEELAARKKALIFSIESGKNYIINRVPWRELSAQFRRPCLHVCDLENYRKWPLRNEWLSRREKWWIHSWPQCRWARYGYSRIPASWDRALPVSKYHRLWDAS